MKQHVYLFLSVWVGTISCGRWYEDTEHRNCTFDYYVSKTKEISQALTIDISNLTFVMVGHNPTHEELQAHPNVVFLYVEKLNSYISQRDAFFECLVEVLLSRISSQEWNSINNVMQKSSFPKWMPYAFLLPLGCYIVTWIIQRPTFSLVREIPFALVSMGGVFLSTMMFDSQDRISVAHQVKINFAWKKFFIQADMIHKLFDSYVYAPIALYGSNAIRWQYLKTDCQLNCFSDEYKAVLANVDYVRARWAKTYPYAYQNLFLTDSLTI